MRHTITLSKWSAVLEREDAKKFQINPGFIVAVEELSPRSDQNIGPRTRVDYVLTGNVGLSLLVWESSDQIDALIVIARESMRQAMVVRKEQNDAESKVDRPSD